MDFWGVKVKPGRSFHVNVGEDQVLRLAQISLGETKTETKKAVLVYITVDGKKFLFGNLHPVRRPQQIIDLVLDKAFQISHDWTNGSVHFYGSVAEQPGNEDDIFFLKGTVSEDDTRSDDDEQSGKKRPKAAASKTPSANKKAKKTEGKEAGVATPRPSKQAAGGNKSNQKFPASDGAHILKPCKRHTSK